MVCYSSVVEQGDPRLLSDSNSEMVFKAFHMLSQHYHDIGFRNPFLPQKQCCLGFLLLLKL